MTRWKTRWTALLAVVAFAALLGGAAKAVPTIAVDGSYTTSVTAGNGGASLAPTITRDITDPFALNLALNTSTTPTNFISIAPANCNIFFGLGCGTATDTIHVTFAFTEPTGATGNLTATGAYTANYANQTDSITWTSTDPLVVDFSDGAVLDITLNNTSDWTLIPTISFKLTSDPTPTPTNEPGSLALLGIALFGLGLVSRFFRPKRQTIA